MCDYQNFLSDCEKKIQTGEWEKNFRNYLSNIKKMEPVGGWIKKVNENPDDPFGIYTSVSGTAKSEYDIRYYGLKVATVKGEKVNLTKNVSKYFDDIPNVDNLTPPEAVEKLSKMRLKEKLRSPERLVESRVLKYMKLGRCKKYFRQMQPVTINGLFFQMPTFFKGSNHGKESCAEKGGGIDILARISDPRSHICIMELKDSVTKGEEPKDIIRQAVAYACCIQKLLRSEQGKEWYTFFRGRNDTKDIPNPLVLFACVVVPFGKGFDKNNVSDNKIDEEILFENGDKLRLRYLYLNMNEDYTEIVGAPETNLNLKKE